MDATLLQGLGALLGGTAALGVFLVGLINKSRIIAFFVDREILIAERAQAIQQATDAMRRVASAETMASDYEGSVKAIRQRMDDLQATTEQLLALKPQFEALVGWTTEVLIYTVALQAQARQAGLPAVGSIPPMPSILTDTLHSLTERLGTA